jgi:hypothetical protein
MVTQAALEETTDPSHGVAAVAISSGSPWDCKLFAVTVTSFLQFYIYLFIY